MSEVARLALECADLLGQARELVHALGTERFAAPGPAGSASVGAHLRHVVEYGAALLAGLPSRRVDYDDRARDARIEREPAVAIARIEALRAALLERVARGVDLALAVRSDEPGLPPGAGFLRSSLARELRAVASHTVHHFALIALALRIQGLAVDPRFGVAPATWAHRCGAAQRDASPAVVGATSRSGFTQAS